MMDENQDDIQIDEQEDGSALVDLPEIETEEQPDGSAIITMEDGPEFNPDFYDNLADSVDPSVLSSLAFRYLDLIETELLCSLERIESVLQKPRHSVDLD